MEYISEIYKRANLQKIREFLLMGLEQVDQLNGTYEEELEKAIEKMRNIIREYLKDEKTAENVMNDIFAFAYSQNW